MSYYTIIVGVCLFLQLLVITFAFKPVVLVHGIMDHRDSLVTLSDRISQSHLSTNVIIIDKLHGWKSVSPLWYQVKMFKKIILPIMEDNPGGIHLIGFSQGGLVARGLIESMPNHNVHTFVSLSAPQGGQFGDDFLKIIFPGYVKETAWKFLYSDPGQMLSIGNYWRDPHHLEAFKNHSNFLPLVDNVVISENSNDYKKAFSKLKRLVLLGGPDDGIIQPWESSHFGVYSDTEEIVSFKEREVYKRDLFGLRTLDKLGKIVRVTVPGIKHLEWHQNQTIADNYIIPYLD